MFLCMHCSSYFEDFNSGIGTFNNAGWVWDAAGTPSGLVGTGPGDDVTGGGYYMYYETSGYSPNITLSTECLDISTLNNPTLKFYYHMYGSNIGSLDVTVNGNTVWTLSGDQGNQWYQTQVDLSAYSATDIIVSSGTHSGSGYRDMALDNIGIGELDTSVTLALLGCIDTLATNYNALANFDDGSCVYPACAAPAPYHQEFSSGALPSGYCPNQWATSVTTGSGWVFSGTPGFDAYSNGRPTGTYAWIIFINRHRLHP